MYVLVVEDDRVARTFISETLLQAGYQVVTAEHGLAALEMLERYHISIIISDWQMPEMDGIELCNRVRSQQFSPYRYFILLTGCNEKSQILRGLESGADDYITKPYDASELILRTRIGARIAQSESIDMTLYALAKIVEMRSQETGGHLYRVGAYSELLAATLRDDPTLQNEIDEEFLQLIAKTSWVHDIGKIAIPDSVLAKPSGLTVSEREVVKLHTAYGAEAFQATIDRFYEAPFLVMARNIAQHHHEHFDGAGYPKGLKGDEIPLEARIVSIADAYDCITSRRIYKSELSHDVARVQIVGASGTQFDPRVVTAFERVERVFEQLKDTLSDDRIESNWQPIQAMNVSGPAIEEGEEMVNSMDEDLNSCFASRS